MMCGFAVMNPLTTMAMVDTSRWRPVVYADTPRCLGLYQRFVAEKRSSDQRRVALFLFGGSNLVRVSRDRERFATVLVFDDLQNLHALGQKLEGFEVVDVKKDEKSGAWYPMYLSPVELGSVLDKHGIVPASLPLLNQVTNALGRRRPSVLENTSRMPLPEAVPESGAQRLLADVKGLLGDAPTLPWSMVLDHFTKYLFRIIERSKVTTVVTKKLPEAAKTTWKTALDFADSEPGLAMAHAYRALCRTSDPDYRVSKAVIEYDLRSYSGDFLYFTSVLPPHRGCRFVEAFDAGGLPAPTPLVRVFKPKPETAAARKQRPKRARSRA